MMFVYDNANPNFQAQTAFVEAFKKQLIGFLCRKTSLFISQETTSYDFVDNCSDPRSLEAILPAGAGPYPLHELSFDDNEAEYVKDCIEIGRVSSVGAYVDKFEDMLANYTSVNGVVATIYEKTPA